jgi:hypothetical protein
VSIRSRLFALPMPGFVRKAGLSKLARLTAEAFGDAYPGGRGLSFAECLERYAEFTSMHAETLLRSDDSARSAAQTRLFSNAQKLGGRLRVLLGIRSHGDPSGQAMSVARALYRMIGVDFKARAAGRTGNARTSARFTVRTCFFSSRYSPEVCRLISSLDAGLLSGLTGGGELVFARRMTEGAIFCEGEIG